MTAIRKTKLLNTIVLLFASALLLCSQRVILLVAAADDHQQQPPHPHNNISNIIDAISRDGARIEPKALRLSSLIDLRPWEAVAQQLDEVRDRFEASLALNRGGLGWETQSRAARFREALTSGVEEPLRRALVRLHSIQRKLVWFSLRRRDRNEEEDDRDRWGAQQHVPYEFESLQLLLGEMGEARDKIQRQVDGGGEEPTQQQQDRAEEATPVKGYDAGGFWPGGAAAAKARQYLVQAWYWYRWHLRSDKCRIGGDCGLLYWGRPDEGLVPLWEVSIVLADDLLNGLDKLMENIRDAVSVAGVRHGYMDIGEEGGRAEALSTNGESLLLWILNASRSSIAPDGKFIEKIQVELFLMLLWANVVFFLLTVIMTAFNWGMRRQRRRRVR